MTRLFVSDLDGTLLQDDASLSDFARRELARMLGDGLIFTVASARSVASMRPILDGIALSLPVIEFNGAMATCLKTGERRFCHVIPPDVARGAAEAGADMGTVPFVSTAGECPAGDALYPPARLNDGMRAYFDSRDAAGDPRLRRGGPVEQGLAQRVVCLTFINRRESLEALCAQFESELTGVCHLSFVEDSYVPGWWWLTLHPAMATKARATRHLADELGLAMSDVTVFGDNVNDLPMFEAAGHAVAVENAVDDLKLHADEIIGPNTADSVVEYLARRWRP